MRSIKRDFKEKDRYGKKPKKNKHSGDDNKTLILKYILYIIIIIIISIIIGIIFNNSLKDRQDNNTGNKNIEDTTNNKNENDSVPDDNNVKTYLIALGTGKTLINKETETKEILSYILLIKKYNKINYMILPHNLLINDKQVLPKRLFNTKHYNEISNFMYEYINTYTDEYYNILLDGDLYIQICRDIGVLDQYITYGDNYSIMENPSLDYLSLLPVDADSTMIYNHMTFHTVMFYYFLSDGFFISKNYDLTMLVEHINSSTEIETHNILDILLDNNLDSINPITPPISINSENQPVINLEDMKSLMVNIINDEQNIKLNPVIAIVNGSETPLEKDTIIKYFNNNNIETAFIKNGDIINETQVINTGKDINNVILFSQMYYNIPVRFSFYTEKDNHDAVLYLGNDFDNYFDFR